MTILYFMPTEEEIIKQRLLQQKQAEQAAMQNQFAQQAAAQQAMEGQLKAAMLRIMEPEARQRLSNLKLTKPELATQLEVYLVQLYQAGQIQNRITEQQVIQILQKLNATRDTKITRK